MKVLILTASFGDSHSTAARNVREALEILDPDGCRIEVIDLLEAVYGRLNQLARSAYLGMVRHVPGLWRTVYNLIDTSPSLPGVGSWVRLRRALSDILDETEPDVVISTYPVYGDVVAELYRDHADRPFRFLTIVTDSISINAAWCRSPSDLYCVANERTAEVLLGQGVDRESIAVTGFPVHPSFFSEEVPEPAVPVRGVIRRILCVVNSSRMRLGRTLEDLLEMPDTELTVTAGRDSELRARLHERLDRHGDRVRILGWTNLMPRLLLTHHLVIGKAGGASVQEAIAARCPLILNQTIPGQEEGNARLVLEQRLGCVAQDRTTVVKAVENAFANHGAVWREWRGNLEHESRPGAAFRIAELVLREETGFQRSAGRGVAPASSLPRGPEQGHPRGPSLVTQEQRPLLCDFHTHTNYSDGKLTVAELVDFYGAHGFDCICVTDHLADPRRVIGKLSRLSRLTLSPTQMEEYFEVIRHEADRAWRRYRMLVMAGIEFNKDGCRPKTSAHLLGIDLRQPVASDLDLAETIHEIHAQGGLAVASHPHVMKSEWGKNTLYLWENQDKFAPLLDAWEIANRDNIFSPVALKRLPFLANSDFHKPKHIYSWKTVLDCPKDPEAIKECIRRNERVSITLYRQQKFSRPVREVLPMPVTALAGATA